MKTELTLAVLLTAIYILSMAGCAKESEISQADAVTLELNPSSSATSNLGRTLFYDTRLSVNNSISCASCHKQQFAFADNKAVSAGFQNEDGNRNTIALQNLDFNSSLFWDGRTQDLSTVALEPITNHVEMGMESAEAVTRRVSDLGYYRELFEKANLGITAENIAFAISMFINDIRAVSTRVDFDDLNPEERKGGDLFFMKYNCGHCHNISPTGYGSFEVFSNIGLDVTYKDNGLGALMGNTSADGMFKVPNLRNVAHTAPYMHDGRFTTLDQVLEHYSHDIAAHPNLDPLLLTPDKKPLRMNISADEKKSLIAFLNAMSDGHMLSNPELSNPFKK